MPREIYISFNKLQVSAEALMTAYDTHWELIIHQKRLSFENFCHQMKFNRKKMSNTYCVLFLFYFSSSCVACVASFSGLSIFILFFFVLCGLCCQFLWIVHLGLPLWNSLTFILYMVKA